ncbi:hypothetical protein PC118_g21843 [Phytophthora cactorum]|uniref:ZSWIM1/3 RNaseH-like domain-containing protein n=1 Tax=Phytophthora cactorum TaxID=29920 RepID=A0A8T1F3L2_9STRA|nr:hypothetical protein PC118_g21843 [Phytophthora cactorum]
MVTDKFGSGAFAQHSLIDGETRANMRNAISAFQRNNEAWSVINVIAIDKDFTELSTLEDEFPEASLILCQFHVIDYLKRSQGNGVMSHNAKYRAAFQICKRIAEVITDKATSKFNRWLENPKDLERTAREDDDPDQIAAPL